jgi:RNA polymerase sigma factor (sigma-70 family)
VELLDHQRMLTAIASGLVGPADADDVVQETFLRALAQPPPDADAPIAPWLVTVARNLALDLLRQRGRFVELPEEGEVEAAAPPLPATLPLPALLSGLGSLSDGEVAVLLFREWMDLDVDEVADALATSPGTVRVLHHRARKKAANGAPLSDALRAVDRFLTWLLGRAVAGLPVVGGRVDDPGLSQGVLVAYLGLLDAMIDLARSQGDRAVEGRARLSRGLARRALGLLGAVEDLELAIELGADRTLAEAPLAHLLYVRGETERALAAALSALGRGDHVEQHPLLHRVAARVYVARGDGERAEPHLAALRAFSHSSAQTAQAAVTRAAIAMDEERFADARADLLVALERNRVAESHSRHEAIILNNLAFAAFSAGELDEALAWAEEGLVVAQRTGDRRNVAHLIGNRASAAHLAGRLDEAATGFERAIAICEENGQKLVAATLRTRAAVVEHQRGHAEQAAAALDQVVRDFAEVPGVSLLARVHLLAALAELGRAEPRSFDELLTQASGRPSLVRALGLFRLLLDRDTAAIERALREPGGTAPADRVARAILERVAREPRKKRRRR